MGQEWCGKWIPRKKTTCARTPGHGGPCKTAETMEYRISSYGLTQEQFDCLLAAQQHNCGMCHEPFEDGQLIHVDHDHACCQWKNRSCEGASEDSCAMPATSHWAVAGRG